LAFYSVTMRIRTIVLLFVAISLGVAVGATVANFIAKKETDRLKNERRDVIIILQGVDFQNRVSMLRVLRQKGVPPDEVAAWEISAVALLQTIDLDKFPMSTDAGYVLTKAAETLAAYRKEFASTEFDPTKRNAVRKLITVGTNKQDAGR
jgi:hypothetical protein